MPDSDRLAFSAGAGYALTDSLTVDVSYTYLVFAERKIDSATNALDGTYTASAHLPALGLNWKF